MSQEIVYYSVCTIFMYLNILYKVWDLYYFGGLLLTECPFHPCRQVLEVVSAIKEQDQYKLADQIYANTCKLFGW